MMLPQWFESYFITVGKHDMEDPEDFGNLLKLIFSMSIKSRIWFYDMDNRLDHFNNADQVPCIVITISLY